MFLHQQHTLIPRWRRVALAFQNMNKDLARLKYEPSKDDAHYIPDRSKQSWGTSTTIALAEEVLKLGEFELYRQYMPMPTLAILIPVFRYLPDFIFVTHINLFSTESLKLI